MNTCFGATVYQRESKTPAQTIENKSSVFGTQISSESDDTALADQIRAQRNARDAADMRNNASTQINSGTSQINCDNALRKCIASQCGAGYSKCATDSDTTFSDKLNACRKNTTCTAHEFNVFTNEIKADRKQEILLAQYTATIDCGNRYNDCIISKCGTHFNKCLGKTSGDRAIADCKQIATECNTYDSGLTSRIGSVFATLRTNAQEQIRRDEQRLYALRDQMRRACESLGAMFDDRTLDCVFTANLFSDGNYDTPIASKKLYAGSVFDCTPDWFDIDITTFKENAYRLTRAQSSASAAMLGSGLGIAAGAITSGAIDRAITSQEALDKLKTLCDRAGGNVQDGKCVYPDDTETQNTNNQKTANPAENGKGSVSQQNQNKNTDTTIPTKLENDNTTVQTVAYNTNRDTEIQNEMNLLNETEKQKFNCEKSGGIWSKNFCQSKQTLAFNNNQNTIIQNELNKTKEIEKQKFDCEKSGGTWSNGSCHRATGYTGKLTPATNVEIMGQQKNSDVASQYTQQSITDRIINRNGIK